MPYTIRIQDGPNHEWSTVRVPGELKDAKAHVAFLRTAGFECKDPRKVPEKKNTINR